MPSVTNICNELYFVAWLVSSENHGNEGNALCFFLDLGESLVYATSYGVGSTCGAEQSPSQITGRL